MQGRLLAQNLPRISLCLEALSDLMVSLLPPLARFGVGGYSLFVFGLSAKEAVIPVRFSYTDFLNEQVSPVEVFATASTMLLSALVFWVPRHVADNGNVVPLVNVRV